MNDYRELLKNFKKDDFLLLHMNIVSLASKQSKLENIIHLSERLPDVIALSENKIKISDNITDAYNMTVIRFIFTDPVVSFCLSFKNNNRKYNV